MTHIAVMRMGRNGFTVFVEAVLPTHSVVKHNDIE